jgi:hypothetical protein
MIIDSFIAIDTEIKINSFDDIEIHNCETLNEVEKKEQLIDEMAKKLDWLMMIFMEFLKIIFEDKNDNNLDIF